MLTDDSRTASQPQDHPPAIAGDPVADAFSLDGYILWLDAEGPKSRPPSGTTAATSASCAPTPSSGGCATGSNCPRHTIRAFLAERRSEASSALAAVAHYALKSFFTYLETEELEGIGYRSPMAGITGPKKAPPPIVPVLTREQMARLLDAANGPLDEALIRLLLDCGLRIGEAAAMTTADVVLSLPPWILVHGKADKDRRDIPGSKTALALRRYLRQVRASQPDHPVQRRASRPVVGPSRRPSGLVGYLVTGDTGRVSPRPPVHRSPIAWDRAGASCGTR